MPFELIFDSTVFSWVILPGLIFISRILDVSLGTIRIIFVSRGMKFLAPLLGFFEILIWLMAISQIMANLNNFSCFVAYAAGFAMGNFVGILIEERLALGTLIVRIILISDECQMRERLYEAGFGVTCIDAHGMSGDVKLIYTIIRRRDLDKVVKIIEACHANAFYSVEEAKRVKKGIFPSKESRIPLAARIPVSDSTSSPTTQTIVKKK